MEAAGKRREVRRWANDPKQQELVQRRESLKRSCSRVQLEHLERIRRLRQQRQQELGNFSRGRKMIKSKKAKKGNQELNQSSGSIPQHSQVLRGQHSQQQQSPVKLDNKELNQGSGSNSTPQGYHVPWGPRRRPCMQYIKWRCGKNSKTTEMDNKNGSPSKRSTPQNTQVPNGHQDQNFDLCINGGNPLKMGPLEKLDVVPEIPCGTITLSPPVNNVPEKDTVQAPVVTAIKSTLASRLEKDSITNNTNCKTASKKKVHFRMENEGNGLVSLDAKEINNAPLLSPARKPYKMVQRNISFTYKEIKLPSLNGETDVFKVLDMIKKDSKGRMPDGEDKASLKKYFRGLSGEPNLFLKQTCDSINLLDKLRHDLARQEERSKAWGEVFENIISETKGKIQENIGSMYL